MVGLERFAEGDRLIDACEAYFGATQSRRDLIVAANMRSFLEACQAHWPEALAAGQRCVRLAWESQLHLWLAMGLWNLPQPLSELGDHERAVRLKGFAERFWTQHLGVLTAEDVDGVASVRASAAECLGTSRVATLWNEGAALPVAAAVALALDAA